jgi:hypothetical protein
MNRGSQMDPSKQNQHLTHKANAGAGRHGWLRLTPAYSVQLVRDHVARLPPSAVVTDPFSGSGTTALAAAEHGCAGQAADLNPFLVWLGTAKVRNYEHDLLDDVRDAVAEVARRAERLLADAADLWAPRLHNIDRWWPPGALAALKALRQALDECRLPAAGADLLGIAFCRTLIAASNAAFNHQSMSFAVPPVVPAPAAAAARPAVAPAPSAAGALIRAQGLPVIERFAAEALFIATSAADPLAGAGVIVQADSRAIDAAPLDRCDLLLTSPPYVNRMSYIRELRPYMYWLRFLDKASDAGELDWQAIGGTWGIATSRLSDWAPGDESVLPVARELREVCGLIEKDGGKNGPLLSSYVAKYFFDMSRHVSGAFGAVRSGGRAVYIIGNSTFYGHVVPAQEWYAAMLADVGFTDVRVTTIRKRNSNKALYEYEVSGSRPLADFYRVVRSFAVPIFCRLSRA